MAKRVKVSGYTRKDGTRVKGYYRKKRPSKGRKRKKSKKKYVLIRDQYGHVLGYEPVKKKK